MYNITASIELNTRLLVAIGPLLEGMGGVVVCCGVLWCDGMGWSCDQLLVHVFNVCGWLEGSYDLGLPRNRLGMV
jgi:hypothetical protein